MHRRRFLGLACAAAGALFVPGASAASGPLRTITYNILGCRGYPNTRDTRQRLATLKPQVPERIALELALYGPDIVTFQEGPAEEVVAAIADRLGMRYAYFPGGWPGNDDWPGGFPGAVLTRFDIVESENCPLVGGTRPDDLLTRHWGRATLRTGEGELRVFSAHLHPSEFSTRMREIDLMLEVVGPVMESGARFLLQGDFNLTPDSAEHKKLRDAGLVDCFNAMGSGPTKTFSSARPRQRIDYVWTAGPLANRLKSCRVLYEGAFRTYEEDEGSVALSDHVPVLAEFS